MKNTLLLVIPLISFQWLSAQHWADVKTDPDANFFEKQAAFEEYWDGKEYEKGKGYKQFKRDQFNKARRDKRAGATA
jgi:hypothetical protein